MKSFQSNVRSSLVSKKCLNQSVETFFCVSILATQTKRQKMFDLLKRKKIDFICPI